MFRKRWVRIVVALLVVLFVAATIAYQNDFLLMTLMGVLCLPLVLFFKSPKQGQAAKPAAAMADAGH